MAKNLEDLEFWLPSDFLCDDLFLDGGEKNGSAEVARVAVGCFPGKLRYGFVRALSFLPSSCPLRGSLDLLFSSNSSMYVVKRDGRHESVHFYKITARLKKLRYGLSQDHCDPVLVAQKVCAGVYKGVTTSQLDELAAETAVAMTANHPNYSSVLSLSLSLSPPILIAHSGKKKVMIFYAILCFSFLLQLAARIAVSNLQKNTKKSFLETIKDMYNHFNERSGQKTPLIVDDVYEIIMKVI